MKRHLPLTLPVLALLGLAAACGGGKINSAAVTPLPTAVTPTAAPKAACPSGTHHNQGVTAAALADTVCYPDVTSQSPASAAPTPTAPAPTAPKVTVPPAPVLGTRAHPFPVGATLNTDDFDFTVGAVEAVDPTSLPEYTQGKLTPGQGVYKTLISADYKGADKMSSYTITFELNLSGAKGKLYNELSVCCDSKHTKGLDLLSDQPEVIAGGHIQGYVYYAMDGDDSAPLFVWNRGIGGKPQFLSAA